MVDVAGAAAESQQQLKGFSRFMRRWMLRELCA
jgi:hypothetical protein